MTAKNVPLGIQLFGKLPETFASAAGIVSGLGPDCIDLNFGCCAQKVCSHGSGAALLKNVPLLYAIAAHTVKAASIPVSAKIRLGWDFSSINWAQVTGALADAGIRFITVHGRTRSQMYTGSADWQTIAEIAAHSTLPVIGNGDITSHEIARRRLSESGCYAVMIGRAALGNPWIFSGHIPSPAGIADEILVHARLMEDFYGEYGMILMRKHLARYIHSIRDASALRGRLVHVNTLADLLPILDEIRAHAPETGQAAE